MTGAAQGHWSLRTALVLALACGHAKPIPSIIGTQGPDTLEGTIASEILRGGDGSDQLAGKGGDDELRGGPGDDLLLGGPGDDLLVGGEGADVLVPGAGEDQMIGGSGADTFVLNLQLPAEVPKRILDFTPSEGDRIAIKATQTTDVEEIMKRLTLLNGVLMLQPDVPGRSATALVRIGNNYRLDMLLKKKSIIFSFDF